MKRYGFTLTLFTLILGLTFATVADARGGRRGQGRMRAMIEKKAEELTEKLNLTKDQKDALAPMVEEHKALRDAHQQMHASGEPPSEEARAAHKEQLEKHVAKAREILTEEQIAICEEMGKEMQAKIKEIRERRGRRGKGGDHGGPKHDFSDGDGVIGGLLLHPHQLKVWGMENAVAE